MGRKLPWAVQTPGDTPKARVATSRSASTVAHTPSSIAPDLEDTKLKAGAKHDPPSTPRTHRLRAKSRTPSTSPPPGPPPISPLRAGYENDDVWMMVEDEFYSVAQSYTAHLHHAEYKRLMRKAKEAPPPREISDLSPPKPKGVRDRARRDALRERQKAAVDGSDAGGFGDDDEDEDETAGNDPWAGTTLAGLMRDGSQNKTSLIGLERLPSSTRAAKGYGKGRTESHRKNSGNNVNSVAGTSGKNIHQSTLQHMLENDESDGDQQDYSAGRNDDDPRPGRSGYRQTHEDAHRPQLAKSGREANVVAGQARTGADSHSRRTLKRSLIDELEDEVDDVVFDPPSSPPLQTSRLRNTRPDRPKKIHQESKIDKKDRRSRLDEVPIFLV